MASGEASVKQAVLHGAVHGRYQGHIEGADACQAWRGWLDPDQN